MEPGETSMALTEKSYTGNLTRAAALAVAAVLAFWLATFLHRSGILTGTRGFWALLLVLLFVALGWRRWRLAFDIVLLNLVFWSLLPMRLGVQNFSPAEIALLAVAIGGAIRVAQTGRFRWYTTPLTPYLALMSLVALLSGALFFIRDFEVFDPVFIRVLSDQTATVFSIPDGSNYRTLRTALTLLEGFIFFHVVAARVRDTRDLRHIVQISLLSATLVGLFGILQYFTDWNRVVFLPWGRRINSTFPDVNSLPSFLLASLYMLAPFLTVESRANTGGAGLFPRPRGMAWWVLPILLVSFWMARSRVAFGAFLLTLPLYLVLQFANLRLERPLVWLYRKRRFLAIVFVLLVVILGFLFLGLDWESHSDLQWTRATGPVARALKGRLNIWRGGFYNLAEEPWLGGGIGTHFLSLEKHWELLENQEEWNWNPDRENAHNFFLQMMIETGVIGGGHFLLIVALVLYQGFRAVLLHRGEEPSVLVGVLCGIVAFLLTCLTGHPLVLVDVNLWFWFVAALLFTPHPSESPEFAREQMRQRGFRRFLLAAVLVVAAARLIGSSKPNPLTFYGYGIHDLEFLDPAREWYPFFWLEKQAVCRLYQRHPHLEFSLRNVLGEGQPIGVTIRVNGREVDRIRLDSARWRACSYHLPETRGTVIRLEVLSDHEWRPPGEKRRLAVQVQSLMENFLW